METDACLLAATCERHTQLLDLLACTHEHYDTYMQAIVARCAQLLTTKSAPTTPTTPITPATPADVNSTPATAEPASTHADSAASSADPSTDAVLALVDQLVRTRKRTLAAAWTAFGTHRALLTSGLLRFLHEQRHTAT